MSDFIGGPYYLPALPITSADDMHICRMRFVLYIPAAERPTTGDGGGLDPSLHPKIFVSSEGGRSGARGRGMGVGAGPHRYPSNFCRPREGEQRGVGADPSRYPNIFFPVRGRAKSRDAGRSRYPTFFFRTREGEEQGWLGPSSWVSIYAKLIFAICRWTTVVAGTTFITLVRLGGSYFYHWCSGAWAISKVVYDNSPVASFPLAYDISETL
jgi:hypothetical protein